MKIPQNRKELVELLLEQIAYLSSSTDIVCVNELEHATALCKIAECIDKLAPKDIAKTIEYRGKTINIGGEREQVPKEQFDELEIHYKELRYRLYECQKNNAELKHDLSHWKFIARTLLAIAAAILVSAIVWIIMS